MNKLLESPLFDFYSRSDESPAFGLPLVGTTIEAGFPSPAEDYIEGVIDLNEFLIRNPTSTFYARAKGRSMQEAGIQEGDLLIIDRSLTPKSNSLCICILDGEFTVKRIRKDKGVIYLVPSNPDFPEIKVDESRDFEIWGVVLHIIHPAY